MAVDSYARQLAKAALGKEGGGSGGVTPEQLKAGLDRKVDKTNSANQIYGTSVSGEQTTFNKAEFASVDFVNDSLEPIEKNTNILSGNLDDDTNTYYPNKTDEDAFNAARNSISGTESTVGSMGFKLSESNFHYGCVGLLVLKPYIQQLGYTPATFVDVTTMTCERYGASQDFTVLGISYSAVEHNGSTVNYMTVLTQETPYLFSDDTYGYSKIVFKKNEREIGEFTIESFPNGTTEWYGCVTQWSKTPSLVIDDYIELHGDYYMPKGINIGAFYYVDVPSDVITTALTNEPTCIKIDANYDSGLRQNYIDWGDDGTLTTDIADQCLKANYTVGDNFLTLTLRKNKRAGQGLEQKPTFGTYSCIRFPDYPEIGNVVVGGGCNNVFGDTVKGLFDYGFASGYSNTSIGRYSVTAGTRNSAVYAGIALGNHNIVLGQSGFAAGATNLIGRGGSNGVTLGSENVINGKNGIAGGRANNVFDIYGIAFGYGNKVKGKSSSALGYTNTLNDDSEFAAGTGNTLSGENAVAIGRANQSYGKSNTCIGYGNIVNNGVCSTAIGNVNHVYANYALAAGNNNTVNADASTALGVNLTVKTAQGNVFGNVGHLLTGSNNVIEGGRNLIVSGQSCKALLHDSIVVGNNLKETSKAFGKAVFGNYNAESGASIMLGAGSSEATRKNAFEVYADGTVKTPNARKYKSDSTDNERLTTKQYVDGKVSTYTIELEEIFNGEESSYTSTSTFADIKSAYKAKKNIQVHITSTRNNVTYDSILPLMHAEVNDNSASIRFGYTSVFVDGDSISMRGIDYSYSNINGSIEESWADSSNIGDYLKLNGGEMSGSIDMATHSIVNVEKLHINGNASIYLGSTVESYDINRPRLTGVASDSAEAAFVKSGSQSEYIPVRVGLGTDDNSATPKSYVDTEIDSCVPNTRTINGKRLDNNITLSASDIGLSLDNWVFENNSFKNETNTGSIVLGNNDIGVVTLNYSGIQYGKTGQTAKTITWENLFAKLDKITE